MAASDKLGMSLDDIISSRPRSPPGRGGKARTGGASARSIRAAAAPYDRAARPTRRPAGGARVFVGNLAWEVSWQDLKDHMRRAGEVVHADVMMEPGSNRSKGCGIVEFANVRDAKRAIETLTDTDLKGRMIFVREDREATTAPALAPAAARAGIPPPVGGSGPRAGGGGGARVFVGNLAWEVSWQDLKDHMRRAGEVVHADVMMEPGSNRSKGCGIVEFANVRDAKRAIETLTDTDLKGRMIFVREDREATTAPALAPAAARAGIPTPVGGSGPRAGGSGRGGGAGRPVSVFVGNLSWDVSWQDLKDAFRAAGEVVHTDVATDPRTGRSKGFGTVQFADALTAGQAIRNLNGKMLRGRPMEVREDRK